MKQLVDNLRENFLGKVCTVLTQPVSFQFADAIQHSQYFTGQVAEINDYGIWLKHLHIDTYAFYAFPIVGIVEEQLIPQDDPRAAKVKEDLKKKPVVKNIPAQNFIPVESLTKMVKDVNKR